MPPHTMLWFELQSQHRWATPLADETSVPEDAHLEKSHSTTAFLDPLNWVLENENLSN